MVARSLLVGGAETMSAGRMINCESHGISPSDHVTNFLTRVQDHPAHAIDEFLPAGWAAAN